MCIQIYVDLGAHNNKLQRKTYSEAVAFVKAAVVSQTGARLRLQPDLEIPYLVVQLSDPFWAFHSLRYALKRMQSVRAGLRGK